ncbi:MmgE/PrpD family protein [Sphingobium sp. EP60837]|uniref:MmgE/PrpD family protein n=1 Tax=Sphingobium sp. EP60837 TaxID=1855519 RepID=UPI0018D3723F|nr:MmgE/PrpD family protein [Sphingobium sp. EP60837]
MTERLAAYISGAGHRELPPLVIEQTKWHILDTLAAIVAGSQLPAGRAGRAFLAGVGGKPVATVIGSTLKSDAINAAMVNGTTGHGHEIDDTGGASGPWHPGINVVSAALALGEQFGTNGTGFLRSVALGYDIGGRVGTAAGLLRNFRTPTVSVCGIFGATAAAACVARLSPEQTRFALSYTAQQSSGIDSFRRDPDHIEKGFLNGGIGARGGVTSVLLVKAGFTAVHDIFEGPANFFALFRAAGQTVQPELMIEGLGTRFDVLAAGFKRRPVAGAISAVLDSLEALLERRTIDPRRIAKIVVRYEPNSVTDNGGPPDANMQHAVAMTLVDKRLSFQSIHDRSRFSDPLLVRLRSITTIAPVTIYNQSGKYIDPSTPGRAAALGSKAPVIQLTMADGEIISQGDVPSRGESSNPYTREWIVEKASSLMTPVLGVRQTSLLVESVLNLEQLGNVRSLSALMSSAHGDTESRLSDWPLRTRS